jgi:RNA polymerase sigma-70 factor (sigma-E family)
MTAADDDFSAYATTAWPVLYRRAYLLSGQHADAEDIAQQTLIRVRRHWGKVRRAASMDAYVLRMLTNAFLSSRRPARVSREIVTAVPDHSDGAHGWPRSPGLVATDEDPRGEIWPLILGLPGRQRAVLVLRYYEDLSEREIADVLDVTPGTVKSTAHKALANLRTALGRELA